MSNLFKDRFIENEESVTIEYEVIDGVIQPINEDTHYGNVILSDEETMELIEKYVPLNGQVYESGFINLYDDVVLVERQIKR
jgi:hypothetical protein